MKSCPKCGLSCAEGTANCPACAFCLEPVVFDKAGTAITSEQSKELKGMGGWLAFFSWSEVILSSVRAFYYAMFLLMVTMASTAKSQAMIDRTFFWKETPALFIASA